VTWQLAGGDANKNQLATRAEPSQIIRNADLLHGLVWHYREMASIIHPVMPTRKAPVWEYLPNGLVRHVATGYYYSRFQLQGKRTMKALETNDARVAKIKHLDLLAKNERTRQSGVRLGAGTGLMADIIREALDTYEQSASYSAKSKQNFRINIQRIERHWPECFGVKIGAAKPAKITAALVEKFSNYLSNEAQWRRHNTKKHRKGYGAVTANVTLETLLRVMVFAKARGFISEVPFKLKADLGQESLLRPEPKKKIEFPTHQKIQEVFTNMRTVGNTPDDQPEFLKYLQRRAHESADFAEFMAYSGARKEEAAAWTWEDERTNSVFIRGTKSETSRDREVPKIPAMVELLARMKARRTDEGRKLAGVAFNISQCREALESACKRAVIDRWTHHTLRHLFATRCIESGVDIPTVSRWLGHADGGALAMKTYGHLRKEHSETQAAKVKF
jgi:integrase